MNYARYRKAIEPMYIDRVDVYRYEDVRDPDTGVTKKVPVLKYENEHCRISQRSLAIPRQTEAQDDIFYETKLFTFPELDILQGDLFKVTRNNVERKYVAGEPFLYPTHQEISIQRREWA